MRSKGFKILVVDDEPHQRTILNELLTAQGYAIITAGNGKEALTALAKDENADVHLVLTDLSMPEMDGLELITQAKKRYPEVGFMMVTAHGTIETAIQAMKAGAFDYLLKPVEHEEVSHRLEHFFRIKKLEKKADALEHENKRLQSLGGLVSKSKGMKELLGEIEKAIPTDATILLTGETGVGKEVVARFIHEKSVRKSGPFVPVNCSAIPDNLLESEFFGHEKGAFTGADRRVPGYFERADGGTLFLDELGEMDIRLQPKILRAIEEKKIRRVGGAADISVDVRFVAATNRDLKKLVSEGKFREDLYFRFDVVQVRIPPLRERKEDLDELVSQLVARHARSLNVSVQKVEGDYIAALTKLSFPGNVRELSNMIERSLLRSQGGVLSASTLKIAEGSTAPAPVSASGGMSLSGSLNDMLADYEKRILEQCLEANQNDVDKTAQALSVSRSTLYSKLSKYGVKS